MSSVVAFRSFHHDRYSVTRARNRDRNATNPPMDVESVGTGTAGTDPVELMSRRSRRYPTMPTHVPTFQHPDVRLPRCPRCHDVQERDAYPAQLSDGRLVLACPTVVVSSDPRIRCRWSTGRPRHASSPPRGFVWNLACEGSVSERPDASTPQGFVWNSRMVSSIIDWVSLQPHKGSSGTPI